MTEANIITLCLKNTMQLKDWFRVHQRFTGLAAMKQGGGGERWTEAVVGVRAAGMDGQVRRPRAQKQKYLLWPKTSPWSIGSDARNRV